MMYALTDYAYLSQDMLPSALMSKMLSLCYRLDMMLVSFLCGAFLKCFPADVRSHLVHYSTSDPLSLALRADEIHQSQVFSASAVNHVHSAPEDCPVLAVRAPPISHDHSQPSPTPGPRQCHPSAPPTYSLTPF